MEDYSVIGRVIDHAHVPVSGLTIRVMHRSELHRSGAVLTEGKTDAGGRFSFSVDRRDLRRRIAGLGRIPRVYLSLHSASGGLVYATRETPIEWQLEFRVFLGDSTESPNVPDLYASAMRRTIAGSREAGIGGRALRSMGGQEAGSSRRGPGGWRQMTGIVEQDSELEDSVNLVFAAMDGVISDKMGITPLKLVKYDGAQVPRRAWTAPDHQAIIWPRKEPFRWA